MSNKHVITFKIERVIPHRGRQSRKVFIYDNDEFCEYLWMSDADLYKNKVQVESEGNEFVLVNETNHNVMKQILDKNNVTPSVEGDE